MAFQLFALSAHSEERSPFLTTPVRTKADEKVLKEEAAKALPIVDQTKWDKLFFDQKTQKKLNLKGLDPKSLGQGAWGSGDGAVRADGSIVLYDLAESAKPLPTCKIPATLIPKSSALEDLGFDLFTGREKFPPYLRAQALIANWQKVQAVDNVLLLRLSRALKDVNFIWLEAQSLPAAKRLKTLPGYTQSVTLISYMDPIGIVASRELWNRLDGCSQSALMLHEAFRHLKSVSSVAYPDERIRAIVRMLVLDSPKTLSPNQTSDNPEFEIAIAKFFAIAIRNAREIALEVDVKFDSEIQEADAQAEVKNLRRQDPTQLRRYLRNPELLAAMAEGLLTSAEARCNSLTESEKKSGLINCEYYRKILALSRDQATYEYLQNSAGTLTSAFSGLANTVRTFPLEDLLETYTEVLERRASAKDTNSMKKMIAVTREASEAKDGTALFVIYLSQIAAKNSEK